VTAPSFVVVEPPENHLAGANNASLHLMHHAKINSAEDMLSFSVTTQKLIF